MRQGRYCGVVSDLTAPQQEPDAVAEEESGLQPYRLREHDDAEHDIFDEAATYEDGSRPGTVAAVADQPFLVKARQREEFADTGAAEHHDPKPKYPFKLTGATWKYSIKRSVSEFGRDQCSDLAAALTYYAVLSVFPALIALVSILGLIGEAGRVQRFFVDMVDDMTGGDPDVMDTVELIVGNITGAGGAGIGLAIGILMAIWTASNYVNAFSRAMNRIFEVDEGRPVFVLRPLLYATTVALIVLVACSALVLVVSGPLAASIGHVVGLGETAVTVWNWATPVVLVIMAAIGIALLYYITPNIRQPGPLWVTLGALMTIVVMILTTAAVGFYVMNFANYDATYGSLASVIIFLFWIYIMNVVLLFGAEFDAELERGRQLQAGIEAERTVMLPPRQSSGAEKKNAKYEELVAQGHALRVSRGETTDPEDAWRR